MVEAEATESDGAPSAPVSDWTNVRGFQVLAAAAPDAEASPAEAESRVQLAKELGARAARFAQAVDESIVLASDGLIRWLGDPVARLIAGDDLLRPKAVLLADEALSAEDRDAVQTRLGLWINAHITKVLGPLETLAEPGAVSEPVRALAIRVSQALGVLERERVRQQVKTLDQNARSALRKLGVRFGSLYIFVPALLKPGSRTLCSQLWGLRRGEVGAERLLAFAAAGRTSFAAEAPLGADTYRVAGFRLCGDRVVRIDIVERLNDLIRAAIPDHMRPGSGGVSEASGFLVTPQMTSLTGCAGESFASILRSLGYESHRVKRSEFEAAMRKPTAAMKPIEAPVATSPAEAAIAPASDAGDGSATNEIGVGQEAVSQAPPHLADDASTTSPGLEEALVDEAPPAHDDAEPEAVVEEDGVASVEAAPDDAGTNPPAVIAEASPSVADESDPAEETASAETNEAAHVAEETASSPLDGQSLASAASRDETPERTSLHGVVDTVSETSQEPIEDSAETESPADETAERAVVASEIPIEIADAADNGAQAAAEEEWIEVWRPAPRRRPQPAPRPTQAARVGDGDVAHAVRPGRDQRRRWNRDQGARPEMVLPETPPSETPSVAAGEARAPETSERPRDGRRPDEGGGQRQERGRRHFQKGSRPEEARPFEGQRNKESAKPPVKKEYRPPPVDMDSPFAKLLALKPLLERRDKRT